MSKQDAEQSIKELTSLSGSVPSTSQTNVLLDTFNDRYKSHAQSRTGDWVDPATRFAAAIADTANSLYQQPMTASQRQTSLEGYSALCQKALSSSSESPADPGDFYGQLQRIYQSSTSQPSTELPSNKHPNQLKGDWDWTYRDSTEKMLDGISIKDTDFGKWPDKGDQELSRISLQPADFQDETSWLKLNGRSQGPWRGTNSPRLTRKEMRARKRQTQIDASTATPSLEPSRWLTLTQATGQVSRPI